MAAQYFSDGAVARFVNNGVEVTPSVLARSRNPECLAFSLSAVRFDITGARRDWLF